MVKETRRRMTFISNIPEDFKKRELFLILLRTQGCYWGPFNYEQKHPLPLLNRSVWIIWRQNSAKDYIGRIEMLYSKRGDWQGWHIYDITYERAIEVITRKLKWKKNGGEALDY